MKKSILVREKVSAVVAMLARKKIKVTQQGSKAYTKYTRSGEIELINIPYIPDDASQEFLDAIEGFLDHEVGHALFSDVSVIDQASKQGVAGLHNLIEDTFVERRMAEVFPGSGNHLSSVGRFFLQNYTDKKIAEGGEDVVGAVMVPAVRALAGQAIYKDYMEDKWSIVEEPMSKVGEYLTRELPKIASSADALRVAKHAAKLLDQDSEEGDADGDSPSESKKTAKGNKSKKKSAKGGEKEREKEAPESEDLESEDLESEEAESTDGEDNSDDSDESDESDDSDESDESTDDDDEGSEGDEKPGEDEKPSEKPKKKLSDSSELSGFDKKLDEVLSNVSARAARDAKYLVWTTDHDKIEPLDAGEFHEASVKDMQDRVDHMVGPLQKDLERAIASMSKSIWTAGHRSGRINATALARLTSFNDERAFRRKHEHTANDVAVTLLIDCSGSMTSNNRIRVASETAYALASVLERIRISTEVLGFSTGRDFSAEAHSEARRLGVTYARYEALNMPIIKGFAERVTPTVKNRLAYLGNRSYQHGLLRNNVDGECVQIAATRLSQRREKRKILMVLSDGKPACAHDSGLLHAHLKGAVKDAEKGGIEVLGIGIQTSDPKKYYPKCVTLNNVSDLPGTVIREIKKLLVKN